MKEWLVMSKVSSDDILNIKSCSSKEEGEALIKKMVSSELFLAEANGENTDMHYITSYEESKKDPYSNIIAVICHNDYHIDYWLINTDTDVD